MKIFLRSVGTVLQPAAEEYFCSYDHQQADAGRGNNFYQEIKKGSEVEQLQKIQITMMQ
jgi:hypothetical protein